MADIRARRVLRDGGEPGPLGISEFRLNPDPTDKKNLKGVLTATIHLRRTTAERGPFRVTIAMDTTEKQPFLSQETVSDSSEQDRLIYSAPVLAPRATRAMAIVVEDLATGDWGSARLRFTER